MIKERALARVMRLLVIGSGVLAASSGSSGIALSDDFPRVTNTQRPGEEPPTPIEAAATIKVPPGFQVTLFAGEPDVRQPIAIDFDDRGRLLVAECYTYTGREFDGDHLDRVVMLHDVDGDGRFDERKVFWDKGWMLSSIAWGFDGLWVLHDGTLSHIADRDHDDVPDDEEPVVHLDGFTLEAGHNVVNGLMWGPDGWLYGRHGIQATSLPGRPGTPESERTPLNCGIWRYHPTRQVFEVVARGTTNPWGMDYDENGQFFFTNNVIGHAWHLIPGAHYKRMYGEDFNPHLYELIDQHADHYHWDITGQWQASRDAAGKAAELGGGHSHCGGMIYLGDNWPEQYRGGLFMCNTHGRRVNHDVPVQQGSGYVLKHAPDMIFANQPWFRGVSLAYGPDGGVFVTDWSDLGECHDHDGVHRTSGRIYKITYGTPKAPPKDLDLAKLSGEQLVELLSHPNQWYVRRARRQIQERVARVLQSPVVIKNTGLTTEALKPLKEQLFSNLPTSSRLNILWALVAAEPEYAGEPREKILARLLSDPDEHLRAWAVRLLVEPTQTDAWRGKQEIEPIIGIGLAEMAKSEQSPLVRLQLSSAMQRLPAKPAMGLVEKDEIGGMFLGAGRSVRLDEPRWQIAEALAKHGEDVGDHNLPLMIWFGLEPLVPTNIDRSIRLAETTPIPILRRHIARRIASLGEENRDGLNKLFQLVERLDDAESRGDVLLGVATALRGARRVEPPKEWEALRDELVNSKNSQVAYPAQELAVVFGDGRTMEALQRTAADVDADPAVRRDALEVLIRSGEADLSPFLGKLISDRAVGATAVRGLASVGNDETPIVLLKNFGRIHKDVRPSVVAALTVREPWALALLDAVAKGEVPKEMISAADARQIASLGSERVDEQLSKVWGTVRVTPDFIRDEIERMRGELNDDVLANADGNNGRGIYMRICGNCHKLYGEGAAIGPDLTGSNRANLDYLLENMLDPSATVPEAYRSSVVVLADGRVLTGVVVSRTENRLTLQTATEKVVLDTGDVEEVKVTDQSLMPNGLLDRLSPEEVRDLIGYVSGKARAETNAK